MTDWHSDKTRWRQRLVWYATWLVPASVAAALSFKWWLGVILIAPGVAWYLADEAVAHYRRTQDAGLAVGSRIPALMLAPLLVAAAFYPSQFLALFIACALILIDGLTMRGFVKARSERRETESPVSALASTKTS